MVRSWTCWRFSEVEAAPVVLSSSRCAAARVWKPTPDGRCAPEHQCPCGRWCQLPH